jgi:carbonic anhydrase
MTNALPLGIPIMPGTPVDNESPTKAFVIACVDPRYINVVQDYLAKHLGKNGFTYDLFILAGASLGGLNPSVTSSCSYVSAGTKWADALFEHIQVAILLHNVTQVLIFDHLDCGAYKLCNGTAGVPNGTSDSTVTHIEKFTTLRGLINARTFTKNSGGSGLGSAIFTSGIQGYIINDGSTAPAGSLFDIQTSEYLRESYPVGSVSGARVLVLGCIDPRFSALLTAFLRDYKGVKFTYDLTILAGASIGANQSYTTFPATRTPPALGNYPLNLIGSLGKDWGPTFFDHISIAKALHDITEVWVFDHLDCGAYKRILYGDTTNPDNSIADHTAELVKLQTYIATYTVGATGNNTLNSPFTLAFKGFVMGVDGAITKVVDDGNGVKLNRYEFTPVQNIRDSSDYTKYKKQIAIYNSTQIDLSVDPWFPHGHEYKLDWLNGKNKCTGCKSGAFNGGVTFN